MNGQLQGRKCVNLESSWGLGLTYPFFQSPLWLGSSIILPKEVLSQESSWSVEFEPEVSSQESRSCFEFESGGRKLVILTD